MKKIALLHGAYVNAGDFLIKNRMKDLLAYYYKDVVIEEYLRNSLVLEDISKINECDVVVMAGGPLLSNGYSNIMPFEYFDLIKKPIMLLGVGWFGASRQTNDIYNYVLDDEFKRILLRCVEDTGIIGCRDYYSMNILRNIGITDSVMTGCPAWYYLPKINNFNIDFSGIDNVKTICISDSAKPENKALDIALFEFLRKEFKRDTRIYYVMHRNNWLELENIKEASEKYEIKVISIAGSDVGLSIYDSCDIHIGFRVHAHIYNLSKRRYSILIEEDGRGAGVNDALGLPAITAYSDTMRIFGGGDASYKLNDKMCFQIQDCLYNYKDDDYIRLENSFLLMNRYFRQMEKIVLCLRKYLE